MSRFEVQGQRVRLFDDKGREIEYQDRVEFVYKRWWGGKRVIGFIGKIESTKYIKVNNRLNYIGDTSAEDSSEAFLGLRRKKYHSKKISSLMKIPEDH
jgi:hypothetical protein